MLIIVVLLSVFLLLLLAAAWHGSEQITRRRIPDEQRSPAEYGLDFEEISFPARDGLTLRGWFIPAPDARGTVIFCHGHAGSMDPDLKYAPDFHNRGYNVLMFDFRGHGRSDGDRVSMGYFERLDLGGAVDFLKKRGINKVGVLGFSMGGAVAISTAAQEEAIKAVVSDGTFARLGDTLVKGAQVRYPSIKPLAWLLARLALLMACLRLRVWLPKADPIRLVGRISPRALFIIHGAKDPFISLDQVKELYEAAGEPKELWIAQDAGHREVDQLYPDEYRTRVLDFFDRWLGKTQHNFT